MELLLTQSDWSIVVVSALLSFILLLIGESLLMLVINNIKVDFFNLFQKENLLFYTLVYLSKFPIRVVAKWVSKNNFTLVDLIGGREYELL